MFHSEIRSLIKRNYGLAILKNYQSSTVNRIASFSLGSRNEVFIHETVVSSKLNTTTPRLSIRDTSD